MGLSLRGVENRISRRKMIHFGGGHVSGRLKYDFFIFWCIFVHCLSLLAYICPLPVTIGVYLSIACHYRRIFVHCLSLSAYICPSPGLKYYGRARLGPTLVYGAVPDCMYVDLCLFWEANILGTQSCVVGMQS